MNKALIAGLFTVVAVAIPSASQARTYSSFSITVGNGYYPGYDDYYGGYYGGYAVPSYGYYEPRYYRYRDYPRYGWYGWRDRDHWHHRRWNRDGNHDRWRDHRRWRHHDRDDD